MSSRLSVAVLAAVLWMALFAAPARAQTPDEMAGAYHMTVVSKYGPCGTDPTFDIEVKGFEGSNVSLVMGGQPYNAPFDAAARRFRLETADNGMGFRATMDGRFSRTADAVVLEADATWAVGCGGKIVGQHPAANTGPATPPPIATGEGDTPTVTTFGPAPGEPPQTYTYGGASAPQPSPACASCSLFSSMCMILWLVFFLLGLAAGWLLFRGDGDKRRKPDEAQAEAAETTEEGKDAHD